MADFVLDSSVAVAWFFADESQAYCNSVLDSIASQTPVVPAIWPYEVANAVLVGVRRKRSTREKADEFFRLLTSLPIQIEDESCRRAFSEVWTLANHGLSIYDTAYLEFAIRHRLPLAAIDRRLRAAARGAGVVIFSP